MGKTFTITALIVAAVLTGTVFMRQLMKKDVASVERDIRDHLPIGSSRAAVSEFLDQRKIVHSHIGAVGDENSNTEMAMIRDVSRKAGVRADIQILFKFDNTDSKLVSYTIREIFTGP